jgi:YVTN family beta-propeller protein
MTLMVVDLAARREIRRLVLPLLVVACDAASDRDLTNAPRQVALKHIPVVKGPEGMDLAPDGLALWVAGRTAEGGISVIDPKTDAVVRTIATTTKTANRVKFTRHGARVLVSDVPSVQVLDPATWTITAEVETGNEPDGMAYAAAATPASATAPRP